MTLEEQIKRIMYEHNLSSVAINYSTEIGFYVYAHGDDEIGSSDMSATTAGQALTQAINALNARRWPNEDAIGELLPLTE